MATIHYKTKKTTKKTPEIERFKKFKLKMKLSYAEIAANADIAERTVAKYVHDDAPLSGQLLRSLATIYGVSIDWILTGKGAMFVNEISETPTEYTVKKGVINDHKHVDLTNFQDFWWLAAKSTEQSLIQSGAIPGEDYSIMDLYKLAQPFVLEKFKNENIDVSVFHD